MDRFRVCIRRLSLFCPKYRNWVSLCVRVCFSFSLRKIILYLRWHILRNCRGWTMSNTPFFFMEYISSQTYLLSWALQWWFEKCVCVINSILLLACFHPSATYWSQSRFQVPLQINITALKVHNQDSLKIKQLKIFADNHQFFRLCSFNTIEK